MIYPPKEDSFLLEKEVRKYARGKAVLDVGSGSGIQSRAAIESGAKKVIATEIDNKTIKFLRKQGIKTIKSNLLSNIKVKFDLIIFNPPYLPEDKREDLQSKRITTGGKKGDEIIIKFLKQIKSYLKKGSIILIVISSLTPQHKIKNLMKKENFRIEILSRQSFFMETIEVWKITPNNNL